MSLSMSNDVAIQIGNLGKHYRYCGAACASDSLRADWLDAGTHKSLLQTANFVQAI